MDVKKLESRNTSLDIIRVVAVFLVNSVHFFLYNGFYTETVQGVPYFVMTVMRVLFTACVPLFMILTGYLMSKKTLSKSYYKGIRKTLIVYALATVACIAVKILLFHDSAYSNFTLGQGIMEFLNFKGATYSWYIEFYIGLFLIAPFLNLMYNGLKTQRQKQVLVFTFFAIAVLPSIFNSNVFSNPQWWATPTVTEEYEKIMPAWWTMTYPVAYYLVGAYLREYGFKMKTRTLLIGFSVVLLLFSAHNYYRFYGSTFKYGTLLNWNCFEAYVISCGLFILLLRIPTKGMPNGLKWLFWKVSDLALGIYLLSFIFDHIIYYDYLNKYVSNLDDKLPYYFITVPIVFVLSALASIVVNFLASYVIELYESIVKFIKKQRARDDKEKWRDIMFFAFLVAAVIFAIWKCFYGFGGNDEAFYLTVPQRLLQGDALFTQEWHLSQMSSIFLLPFLGIYHMFAGSFEGVILAARVYYVILHAVVASVVYWRLRKYGYVVVFASLFFFIYSPYDIMAYSYNTMAIDFVVLSGVILGTTKFESKIALILGGLFFAASVLCSPYLAIGYAIYIVCVLAHLALKKKDMKCALKSELFSLKSCLWITVGIAALAVVFLIFVLTRTGFGDIMNVLPKLLSDPEHPQISMFDKIGKYFQYTVSFHPQFIYAVLAYGITALVMLFDKKRRLHRSMYLIVTTAIVLFTYALLYPTLTVSSYNYIMYPMLFVGITSYVLCEEKPRELFVSLFCLGILYSFAVCMSSNQYFYVISMAMCTANVASFVFLARLIKEMRESEDNLDYAKLYKYSALTLVVITIVLQGYFQLTVKANHCFWETSKPDQLKSEIKKGPAKGINTNTARADKYNSIYNDLKSYKGKTPANFLSLSGETWIYLAMDKFPYATYSAWIGDENIVPFDSVVSRLKEYYSVNPDKTPKYVYIPKDTKWETESYVKELQAQGYALDQNNVSYKLQK